MANAEKPVRQKNWRKKIMRIFIVIVILYVVLLAVLLLFENSLVYPDPGMRGDWQPADVDFEEVMFKSEDGTTICAWFLPAPDSVETPENLLLVGGWAWENLSARD